MSERPGAATFQGKPLTLVGDEIHVGQPSPDFTVLTGGLALQPYGLADGRGRVRILNVVVSLDTPVCDVQTRRLADDAARLPGVDLITISADLPVAQARWAEQAGGCDGVRMLSDHRELSFGEAYGIAIKELRLLGRGVFVLDRENRVVHAEYVKELADQPDYDRALPRPGGQPADRTGPRDLPPAGAGRRMGGPARLYVIGRRPLRSPITPITTPSPPTISATIASVVPLPPPREDTDCRRTAGLSESSAPDQSTTEPSE